MSLEIHKDRKKKGKQSSRVKHLMEITMSKRQKWIQEKSPTVDEVLDKFPHLASVRLVRFVHIVVQSLFLSSRCRKSFLQSFHTKMISPC